MLIPYQFDVPMERWPIANFAIIGITVLVSFAAWGEGMTDRTVEALVLNDWTITSLFGSALLHGDPIHLIGNMIFLWVFGNAVCAKLGNGWYILVYALLALAASMVHNLFDGAPAVGASGAINGVIGMALIWYPANSVSCFFWLLRFGTTFEIDCRFLVALWLMFDIWGAVAGGGNVAYWAHLGGIGAGAGLAAVLLQWRWIEMADTECSIFELFSSEKSEKEKQRRALRSGGIAGFANYGDLEPAQADAAEPAPATPPPAARPVSDLPSEEDAASLVAFADDAPAPAAAPEKVKVRCRCGAKFRVAAAYVGRKGRCPKCSGAVRIEPAS